MRRGYSLTLSVRSGRRGRMAGAALAGLLLAACALEKGPPPESDPPLVPEAAAAAPQQPTEPQSWSRGLDFDRVPPAMARESLARGLVPAGDQARERQQRPTHDSDNGRASGRERGG